MCGIVGYIGNKNAQDFLVGGLKRLEYRGYDSAGIVTLSDDGTPTLLKAQGKISSLEAKIAAHKTSDHVGIGHTRWATHGEPSERNAHPHRSGNIYLVHNGIIENYKELKHKLEHPAKTATHAPYTFTSDTDSEVLAALIDSFYAAGKYPLMNAVVQALKLVRGTYGIAVMAVENNVEKDVENTSKSVDNPAKNSSKPVDKPANKSSKSVENNVQNPAKHVENPVHNPVEIIVARSGSPLVIGTGQHETFLASDASALVGHTKQAIFLNDGEVARLTSDDIEIKTLSSQPVSVKVEAIETDLAAIQKGGYDHFLLKEIMEQPDSLRETLRGRIHASKTVHLGGPNLSQTELKNLNHLILVGCGTAYYAACLASYYLEQFIPDLTLEPVVASEYRYRSAHIPDHSAALVVSQSGETADTLACLRAIKQQGIKTIGIVNSIGSTIAREVDGGTYIHVGPEISVASTKAFTSQAVAMLMFGLTIAEAKGVRPALLEPYIREIAALPSEIEKLLKSDVPKTIQQLARSYKDYDHAIYLGRDTAYPVALEGALKLKEVSYIDANAYPAGELKHGPLALVDDRFFEYILLPTGPLYDKTLSGIEEVLARGGHALVVTNSDHFDLPVENVVQITTSLQLLTPILMNVVSQLFAYYIAASRGLNVDQPRNLAKSVTVE